MEYDPIQSLEAIGYVQREASFLYLVAAHSGYFLRRQYHRFTQRESGRMATAFSRKHLAIATSRSSSAGSGGTSIT